VNPLHTPPQTNLPNVHFDPNLPSTLWSFKWSLSLRLSHQDPVYFSPVSHACHTPRPPHSPWFDLPNNIWWWVQIMKLPIVQLPLSSRYFNLSSNEDGSFGTMLFQLLRLHGGKSNGRMIWEVSWHGFGNRKETTKWRRKGCRQNIHFLAWNPISLARDKVQRQPPRLWRWTLSFQYRTKRISFFQIYHVPKEENVRNSCQSVSCTWKLTTQRHESRQPQGAVSSTVAQCTDTPFL
jgi:hypothetical protein